MEIDGEEEMDSSMDFESEESERVAYSAGEGAGPVDEILSEMVESMQDEDELDEFGGAGEVSSAFAQRIHEAVETLLAETEARVRGECEAQLAESVAAVKSECEAQLAEAEAKVSGECEARLAEAEAKAKSECEAQVAEAEARVRGECEARIAEAKAKSESEVGQPAQAASPWQDECVNRCFSLLDSHVKTLIAEAKELAVLEYIEKNRDANSPT